MSKKPRCMGITAKCEKTQASVDPHFMGAILGALARALMRRTRSFKSAEWRDARQGIQSGHPAWRYWVSLKRPRAHGPDSPQLSTAPWVLRL